MEQTAEIHNDALLSSMLSSAAENLKTDAEQLAARSSEILDMVPGQQQALFLLVSAFRLLGLVEGARDALQWMTDNHPNLASLHFELGLLQGELGFHEEAVTALSRAIALEPNHPAAWRALGDQQVMLGDLAAAAKSFATHSTRSLMELKLLEDGVAKSDDELVKSENMLVRALDINPTDVSLMRVLGDVYKRLRRSRQAQKWFDRALELAPNYVRAREASAACLSESMQWRQAIVQYDNLIASSPDPDRYRIHKALDLILLGETENASALFEEVKKSNGSDPGFLINYGHFLRTVGRTEEAKTSYLKCVELRPDLGSAWQSLANLKIYKFSQAEIDVMLQTLERDDLAPYQRSQLEFALGQAYEDQKTYAASFEHYSAGNTISRRSIFYKAADFTKAMEKQCGFFNPEFIRSHSGWGCQAADPIFIVGLVRAGSTLVEQILASHSQVEGTAELPDLSNLVADLAARIPGKLYPEVLTELGPAEVKALGEQYLEATRVQRKSGRPFFTDKAGQNYVNSGLIHLMLPNAKIIDARRHPLGCGFSIFKQLFPVGHIGYAYDQTDIALQYRDYVNLMAHYDRVLPGKIHRIHYEDVVNNTEGEIRRLLDYCGLPFEESCLRYYETERDVRTSSSEQVRRPISKKGTETWQNYEPWLGPMKTGLGEVLTRYPEVPNAG